MHIFMQVNITFDNNTGYLAPNIYMSNFKLCSWQNILDHQVHFSDKEVMKWPVFNYHNLTRIKYVTLCVLHVYYVYIYVSVYVVDI